MSLSPRSAWNSTCPDVDIARDHRALGVVGQAAVNLGVDLLAVVPGAERVELERAVREDLAGETGRSGRVGSSLVRIRNTGHG